MSTALKYDPADNVVTVLQDTRAGESLADIGLTLREAVPMGHKVACRDIAAGELILKAGQPIGTATADISTGAHVHTQNVKDLIADWEAYYGSQYQVGTVEELPERFTLAAPPELWGYPRKNGTVGFRNHLLVVSTVICANRVVEELGIRYPEVITMPNSTGCVVLPNEAEHMRLTLLAAARNPNVGAVLFVGLGCEAYDAEEFAAALQDDKPAQAIRIQDMGGTEAAIERAVSLVEDLLAQLSGEERVRVPLSALILGTKCGGSDWTSTCVSNPAVGYASDLLIKAGGTSLLGETQGWFGGQGMLLRRARDQATADRIMELLRDIYQRALAAGKHIEEGNPTPGNKAGGITTLNEKALGNVKKSGTAPIDGALGFCESPSRPGLYVLDNPSLDPIAVLGLTCSNAQVVFFTTGRGTPTGTPLAPVIKVSGSPETCKTFAAHIDVDLSDVVRGECSVEEAGQRLFDEMVAVANGKLTASERFRHREFALPMLMGTL